MTDLIAQAEAVAAWLERAGRKTSPAAIRQLVTLARQQGHLIQTQRQEIIDMARNFTEATAVLIAHDKAQTAQVGTLTDANTKLTTDLATAQANAQTPETLKAQQDIIDAAEAAVPSAPPVPPA